MNAQQIAGRLGIPESASYTVIEFSSKNQVIATPILRNNDKFIGGGLTTGGAREFVIQNQLIPKDAIIRVVK